MDLLSGQELRRAIARAEAMTPDGLLPSIGWLAQAGAKVVAQPSGTSLDDGLMKGYLKVVAARSPDGIVLVSRDPSVALPEGVVCAPSLSALREAASSFFGLGYCVMPVAGNVPSIVVTTADYRLVIDVPRSLPVIVGSLEDARHQFVEWCEDPNPRMRRLLAAAAAQMSWIGSSS